MENKTSFPLKKPPEFADKFPFHDIQLYTNPHNLASSSSDDKLGYIAEKSLKHLEATGRKPDLQRVPWFRSTWGRR
jgi:hypothetical protein